MVKRREKLTEGGCRTHLYLWVSAKSIKGLLYTENSTTCEKSLFYINTTECSVQEILYCFVDTPLHCSNGVVIYCFIYAAAHNFNLILIYYFIYTSFIYTSASFIYTSTSFIYTTKNFNDFIYTLIYYFIYTPEDFIYTRFYHFIYILIYYFTYCMYVCVGRYSHSREYDEWKRSEEPYQQKASTYSN